MATKPFTVDGDIVVDEATLSNSTNSLVLPSGSIITGGGAVLDATNSDTDDLTEGVTNLYYTDTRADARIALQAGSNLDLSGKSTTDLSEGTNLYYTDTRVRSAISATTGSAGYDSATGTFSIPANTTQVTEGTNLYYTDARADARITAASITDLSDADQSVQTTDDVTFANITTSGYLRGPASFVIDPAAFGDDTGTVVIAGNLQVDGVQTTINSTTVAIDDLKLSVATDAADSAAANGAGITVGGANANITYTHATTSWDFDKPVNVAGNLGVTGTVDGVDIAARDAILTSTTTTADAALPKAGGTMTGRPVLNYQNPEIRFDDSDTSNNGEITLDNASLRIESDPDNAVADSTIKFNVDNDTKMIVLSSGNVGIGTDSPSATLDVVSNSASGYVAEFRESNASNFGTIVIDSPTDGESRPSYMDYATGGTVKWSTGLAYLDAARSFHIGTGSGLSNSKVTIKPDGNVGIGTSTPDTILEIVSSNPILTLRDTGTGFNNGDATLRLAESGPGDTLGGYFDIRLDASMLKFDFTPEGGSASTYMAINSSDGNVGIGTTSPAGYFHIAGNGTTNDRMFNISTTGVGGGQNGVFYGGKVQVQANNSATENFGWHVYAEHSGIHSPTTGISGEAKTGSSNVRALGVHGISDANSAAVNYGPNTANAQGVVAGVYAEAKTYNSTNNATISALIAQNRASAANTAYGAWINTTPGPTSIIPLSVNHNGTEKFTVNALADAMVHVKGDPADTGTTGGSDGLSIAYDGGRSCPIYFGAETDSAQKSMYMTGYWIYLRGHQNEGIRFVFSQGAGSAPRSDQYQFKYNSATRPTGNTTWDGFSDVRAKENVQNITGALDTISQLRPVVFDWTDDYADRMNMFKMDETDPKSYNWTSVKENGYDLDRKTSQIGFIAQEFETVFPKSITEQELELGDTTIEDFKTVNYDHLIPTLTKAIQELKAENDALKARLDAAGL